jgi:hypothetical protein
LARQFANDWRRKLYSEPFDHPDPVHNAPAEAELATLSLWERLDKTQRERLVHLVLDGPHARFPNLSEFGDLGLSQLRFLRTVLGTP